MYEFNSRVRFSEVDQEQKLTLISILNYFQDCCTFQSEELGIGIEQMKERRQMWVLRSWEIVVHRYPRLGERIRIGTIPYEFGKMTGKRSFVMLDEQEETVAWADSEWVLMDTVRMRPAFIDEELQAFYELGERYGEEETKQKLALPTQRSAQEPFPIHTWQLDINHHVNNGQYVQMAAAYLPDDITVKKMRAEYKKSAVLGDVIYPETGCCDGCYVISLGDEKGKPYAVVEFE